MGYIDDQREEVGNELARRAVNRDPLFAEQAIVQAAQKAIALGASAEPIRRMLTELGIRTTHRAIMAVEVEVAIGETMDLEFVRRHLGDAAEFDPSDVATAPSVYCIDPGRNYPPGWTVGIVPPRQGGPVVN